MDRHAAAKEAFNGDPDLVRYRKDILAAVHALVEAPADQWGPELPLGLRLRGALATYTSRKNALRAEHGQEPAS